MEDESGYEVIEELLEEPVPQIDDDYRDTDPMGMPAMRAGTSSEWPPEPPLPADVDLAQGTVDGAPPVRKAAFYAVVRRPTTSSDTDD
ncbi:MAG TPA: hypothetical protein VIV40_04655 [Kofleriaceae bacterium]